MTLQISPSALNELQQLEEQELFVSAEELVQWVNFTAERFLPATKDSKSKRVSDSLSLRTMRHYQTLGCIDPPTREGREARYGFRHYLQALLVRKMLWLRVPAEEIAALLPGRTVSEYKALLLDGIRLVVQPESVKRGSASTPIAESWQRLTLAEGVELHLQLSTPRLQQAQIAPLLQQIEGALRRLAASQPH